MILNLFDGKWKPLNLVVLVVRKLLVLHPEVVCKLAVIQLANQQPVKSGKHFSGVFREWPDIVEDHG